MIVGWLRCRCTRRCYAAGLFGAAEWPCDAAGRRRTSVVRCRLTSDVIYEPSSRASGPSPFPPVAAESPTVHPSTAARLIFHNTHRRPLPGCASDSRIRSRHLLRSPCRAPRTRAAGGKQRVTFRQVLEVHVLRDQHARHRGDVPRDRQRDPRLPRLVDRAHQVREDRSVSCTSSGADVLRIKWTYAASVGIWETFGARVAELTMRRKGSSGASPDCYRRSAKASRREGVVTARSLTGLHRVLLLVSAVECECSWRAGGVVRKWAMSGAAG